jgi:RES domain-containing protein
VFAPFIAHLIPQRPFLKLRFTRVSKPLDVVPHILTSLTISDPAAVHVVEPALVPNPNWLRPGIPSAGQQMFGDDLLSKYPFLAIPSLVSTNSWNLIFVGAVAAARYAIRTQEPFALDTRVHPPRV